MDTPQDYYQVLGVLPNAEQIVITAAYRALASQYHPDRWNGDPSEATRRMAEVNVAYGVIGDPIKRKEYDKQRNNASGRFDDSEEAAEHAFEDAIQDFETRWKTACDVFPDLTDIRKNLSRTSHKLAFAFVVQVVEQKQFGVRKELAKAMEDAFLKRYFGTNPEIINYAKNLIELGFKDAIKRLNEFIDVLGSQIEAKAVIERVEKELGLEGRRKARQKEIRAKQREAEEIMARQKAEHTKELILESLRHKVWRNPLDDYTFEYARLMGYDLEFISGGFFKPDHYSIRKDPQSPVLFTTTKRPEMCLWIKEHLASGAGG